MIGTLAGFTGARDAARLLRQPVDPELLRLRAGGAGRHGHRNRGAVVGGLALGLFQQAANFLVGGIFASVAVFVVFIAVLLLRPEGLAGAAAARRV